jgi:DNA-nicking Smr family endonuclease
VGGWKALAGQRGVGTLKNKTESRDSILRFLDLHGIEDKDTAASQKKKALARELITRHGVVRQVLDLHGMREEEAEKAVRKSVRECREKSVRELLIIHGYGLHSKPGEGPVLKNLVLTLLEHGLASQIKSFKPAPPRDGGAGATLVFF